MKFIKGMSQIFYDETLSSWIFRSSLKARLRPQVDFDSIPPAPAVCWGRALVEREDWDFNPKAALLDKTIPDLTSKLERASCIFFAKSGRVVGWPRRWWFCTQCLREDISVGQVPGWRKSWCYKDSIVCMVHRVDLQKLLVAPQLSRSWDAFVQSARPIKEDIEWSNPYFQRLRANLIHKVARWKKKQTQTLQNLFDNLYDIFLLAPIYNGNRGQAHELFGVVRPDIRHTLANYLEGVEYGSELSCNKSRFGSIVLCGYLLGAANEGDLKFLAAKSTKFKLWCSYHPDISQAIQFGCASVEDCYVLKSFLGGLERLAGGKLERAVRAYLVRFERVRPGISIDFFSGQALQN